MKENRNFWIFCHYAQQPPYNTMLRYHNWGKYLKDKGYNVTIVAASTVHNTDIDVIKECNGKTKQMADGVRYLYIPAPAYTGNGLKRIKNMMSYCNGLKKFKNMDNQPDVIAICEAYLFPFVKRAYKKVPIISDIVDLWPLSIVEYTSFSNKNLLVRMLYRLEKKAYIKSDAVIFSMEGGIDYIKETKYADKVNPDKIYNINMGCDLSEFDKNRHMSEVCDEKKSKFIVTYSGSLRQANYIIQICEAAKILKEKKLENIYIKFYGNGPEEEIAKKYCQENQLSNVEFLGRFQKKDLPDILAMSDCNIMTYMQTRVMKYGGSQSKLFDYLASGKPIINCGDWGYDLIERHNCGIVVEEQTSENIAIAIQQMYELSAKKLKQMGDNSRRVAEMYDQPCLVDKLSEILDVVLEK